MSLSEKSLKTMVPALVTLVEASVYNNRLVVKYYGNVTMQKALESKSKSIGLIAKEDEDKAVLCVTNLFRAVAKYFDNVLSQEKAEVIATEILYKYEYRNLKLEDLVVICIRLKESDIYKLTAARIMREVSKYSQEREKLAVTRSIHLSESNKNSVNYALEERLQKSFKSLPNANKIASKRTAINKKFK